MDIIYLIIAGMFAGLMGSFFGVGGGSIMIPLLYILYPELPAQTIIPTSLAVILLNSLVNNYYFFKQQLSPSKKTLINFAITCSLGAIIGALSLHLFNSSSIRRFFVIINIIVALRVFISTSKGQQEQLIEPQKKLAITGFLGALISSITGLGGGILFVPLLASFVRLPLLYVSSFSNVAMSFATFTGTLPHLFYATPSITQKFYSHYFIGHVNFLFIFILFVGSFMTSKLGVKLNSTVSFEIKKYLLSFMLLAFGIKILIN